MLVWLTENLGTIIVSLALIAVVTLITVRLIKDKKQGKTSCGCGCEHCAMHGKCHK
ncbi:MAG: FeoB-associated Cys-rich membrane protein [Ruminococcus sp.]|nr:FeoB-associated Cys-rich membrane protein [Ruminococcus sp.]